MPLKNGSRERPSGVYSSQPLEELRVVFRELQRTVTKVIRFRISAPEMLQDSMLRFSDEVSINGHKFIASISTEDLRELLTQKYADIYEEITTRQAQVLENISKEIQNNPDTDKVSEIPQDPSAVLNAIQKVNKEREQLSKPFSVLSELSRKILRYDAIRVTGRVVRGETTDGITLGEGKRWNYCWRSKRCYFL